MKPIFAYLLLASILLVSSCKNATTFELLSGDDTGIHFSNKIVENDSLTILKYEYLYNGSGVGMGDFNNDGLLDIFFSGSQANAALYLNKGEMHFEELGKASGLDTKDRWCSGVSIVDVNGDGLLDVYVSATMKNAERDRQNMLFVNQGIKAGKPSFKEMAAEYGINDNGHSEHAAFFDYDRDGDLDLYVLTDVIDQFPSLYRPKVTDGSYPNTDRLYRNDWSKEKNHPVYTNVSKEAGITIEGYGLGINICDINQDNWPDIYVTNDYVSDDILYINNHDGTFTDQAKAYFKHTSLSAMGNDVADINNDGRPDIVALDMLPKDNERKKQLAPPNSYQSYQNSDLHGYTYQYMRNSLQLNAGKKADGSPAPFQEISLLAGVAETEWSWCPSLADFDNDGFRDLMITNGFPRDVTDRDFMLYRANSARLASDAILLEQMPVIKVNNYAFKNKGGMHFDDVSAAWGIQRPSFSNGASYGDLDNDGDLDYVVNNINDEAFVYKNNTVETNADKGHYLRVKFEGKGQNTQGIGTRIEGVYADGTYFYYENSPYRGYLSSVEAVAHIGLGAKQKIKELRVIWPNDSMQVISKPGIDQILKVKLTDAKQPYVSLYQQQAPLLQEVTDQMQLTDVHKEMDFIDFNFQSLIPFKMSQLGPGASVGDVNGDGLEDFYVGGAKYQAGQLYLQKPNGFAFSPQQSFKADSLYEDVDALFFDADGDKDLDLYVVSGGNEFFDKMPEQFDRLYKNDGKGNFTRDAKALPAMYDNKSVVRPCDFDRDGDIDLFVGGRVVGYHYGYSPKSYLLVNNGRGQFVDRTQALAPDLREAGMLTEAIWADFDRDGDQDLTVVGDWMPIKSFENRGGKLSLIENGLEEFTGFWGGLTAGDFDKDGDMDFVVGNLGTNTKLRKQVDGKLRMLIKDIDKNDTEEHIISYNRGDDWYPINSKDEMGKQIPSIISKKYTKYNEFAGNTIEELFGDNELKGATERMVNTFESVYVENKGKGKFELHFLPALAQVSKVMVLRTEDVDKDGNLDVLLGGNFNGASMYQARYDAFFGLILKGNGKGGFSPMIPTETGFLQDGDVRDIKIVHTPKGPLYFVTRNSAAIQIFKKLN